MSKKIIYIYIKIGLMSETSRNQLLQCEKTNEGDILWRKKKKKDIKSPLPGGELNPGLPRDRRGYWPLYYRGEPDIKVKIITYIFKKMFAPLLHDALSGRVLIYIQCHTILFESLFLFPFLFLFFFVVAYFRQTSAVSVTTSFGALNRPRDNLLLLVLFRRAAS